MSRLGPPPRRGLHHIPPRARWRPLTRRPRVPVRTPVRSPDLTLRRSSVTPRVGDAPSPPRTSTRFAARDGASWTTSSRAAVRPRAATAARGRPRSARRSSGSPPPACAPIVRTSRTPRCASPRLAPTNPHPLPFSWAPRRTDFPTRRIPSTLRSTRASATSSPNRTCSRRTCTSRTSARASPSSTLSRRLRRRPRRRLRRGAPSSLPAPDPARPSLGVYAAVAPFPATPARTVKLQHNRGGGGCFPLHYDNPGPPSRAR